MLTEGTFAHASLCGCKTNKSQNLDQLFIFIIWCSLRINFTPWRKRFVGNLSIPLVHWGRFAVSLEWHKTIDRWRKIHYHYSQKPREMNGLNKTLCGHHPFSARFFKIRVLKVIEFQEKFLMYWKLFSHILPDQLKCFEEASMPSNLLFFMKIYFFMNSNDSCQISVD